MFISDFTKLLIDYYLILTSQLNFIIQYDSPKAFFVETKMYGK